MRPGARRAKNARAGSDWAPKGPEKKSPRRKGLLSEIREDDLLILGLMLLLLRESEGEDPLMLMVLAALLFF